MAAPNLTFSASARKISRVSGYDAITVSFKSDVAYTEFQCRATRMGEEWGVGIGQLIASFSSTPAGTERTFEIYDEHLLHGDGSYQITLLAKSASGEWNDASTLALIMSGEIESNSL